jgi:SEC-C motif-containing protein
MASAAQIEANRLNAAASSGPVTPEGKARSSRNHLKFGFFTTRNCVRPEETRDYTRLSKALWKDLSPVGPVEQMLAVEIVRAAWRLHRCALAEAEDGTTPATQAAVDRARASTHASLRRLLNDLRQFQSDRWLRAEVLREGFDEAYYGIANAHSVVKGLADNERLKSLFIMSPIGVDPLAQTIQTQSVGQASRPVKSPTPDNASRPVQPPVPSPQSLNSDPQSPAPKPQPLAIPRNAPCPCHSGLKYKRCCGTDAPPVLTNSLGTRASEPGPLGLSR